MNSGRSGNYSQLPADERARTRPTRERGPRICVNDRSAVGSQPVRGPQDEPAGDHLLQHVPDSRVAERSSLKLALDPASQQVPDQLKPPERLIYVQIRGISGAGALDRRVVGDQRLSAEPADAGIELLVALAEEGHAWLAQRPVRVGKHLRDHPPVVLVVVPQPGQVHHSRPDVGLIGPRPAQMRLGDRDLAAVRAGRARARASRGTIQAELTDTWPDESDVVGVDLGGVITVIPGKPGVLAHARP